MNFPKLAVGETYLYLIWTNMSTVYGLEISITVFSLNLREIDLALYATVFLNGLSIEQRLLSLSTAWSDYHTLPLNSSDTILHLCVLMNETEWSFLHHFFSCFLWIQNLPLCGGFRSSCKILPTWNPTYLQCICKCYRVHHCKKTGGDMVNGWRLSLESHKILKSFMAVCWPETGLPRVPLSSITNKVRKDSGVIPAVTRQVLSIREHNM